MRYPHLATRLYNSALLVSADRAAVIEEVLRARIMGRVASVDDSRAPSRAAAAGIGSPTLQNRPDRPYPMTKGGVAVVSVIGTLVQRGDSMAAESGLIGYNRIERSLATAFDDPQVKAILIEVDSPGGEASGCFSLCSKVIEARAVKPIWAHANEHALSAAYALACSASRLVVAPTGLVGSIGVIALHVDQSKRDAQMGYSYTPIFAGALKNDFNSHEPLSDSARGVLQAEVDRLGEIFVAHVANAMDLGADEVRATQAGLLAPRAAKAAGFVHGIASFSDTVEELEGHVRGRPAFS